MSIFQKCSHPRTPANTAGVNERHPNGQCRICRRASGARYNATEKARAAQNRYVASEKGQATRLAKRLRYTERRRHLEYLGKFGITLDEYDARLAQQRGVCALCGELPHKRRLAVDHDHATLTVRGLLCGPCNVSLNRAERQGWLDRVRDYLAQKERQAA